MEDIAFSLETFLVETDGEDQIFLSFILCLSLAGIRV